jgi:putative DNA methylase
MITEEMAADRLDLKEYVGEELTVIAWIWARTVKSPNPAFRDVDVPLASTFWLSRKEGKEAYIEPVVNGNYFTNFCSHSIITGKPFSSIPRVSIRPP